MNRDDEDVDPASFADLLAVSNPEALLAMGDEASKKGGKKKQESLPELDS